jgi:hypothetical protein
MPKPSFLPFFENKHEEATGRAGVKYGSDGGLSLTLPPDNYTIEVWATPPAPDRVSGRSC